MLAYQWLRDGSAISGASARTYSPVSADVGKAVSVKVTGSKVGYAATSRTSSAVIVQAGQPTTPGTLTAPTPTISGSAKVGNTLTVATGTWQPAPVALTYQWLRDGVAISGATASSYTLVAADSGKSISVQVTGSKVGYTTVSKVSSAVAVEPTQPTTPGTLTGSTPTIKGTARIGNTVEASPGSWQPAPVALSYQWFRVGVQISGATGSKYVLVAADEGKAISVAVTGVKAGYTSVTKTSAAVVVQAADQPPALSKLTTTPVPKISGTLKVGKKLTASPGTWKPSGVALSYQWFRSGVAIQDATAKTYTLQGADKGKKITVDVTGSKSGYASVTKTSKPTKKVAAGTLTKGKPKIGGSAKVDQVLTASAGNWKPAGVVSLSYQWYRNGKKIAGATEQTYLVTSKDKGKKLTVKVTGKATGYATASKTSAKTKKVK